MFKRVLPAGEAFRLFATCGWSFVPVSAPAVEVFRYPYSSYSAGWVSACVVKLSSLHVSFGKTKKQLFLIMASLLEQRGRLQKLASLGLHAHGGSESRTPSERQIKEKHDTRWNIVCTGTLRRHMRLWRGRSCRNPANKIGCRSCWYTQIYRKCICQARLLLACWEARLQCKYQQRKCHVGLKLCALCKLIWTPDLDIVRSLVVLIFPFQ